MRLPSLRHTPAPPAGPVLPEAEAASAASVRRLRLDVARRLDGLLHGDHLGHLPGPGSEPGEARIYVPGDDVRRIDWAVTARAGDVHVRTPVAERELETTVVVDLTPSMSFGTSRTEKREVAVVLTAALAHLAQGPGDRVGAVVLSDRVRRVPARRGVDAELALLHVLRGARPADAPGPTLSEGLHVAASTSRRRGLVVVVSDLIEPGPAGDEPAWAVPMRRLGSRHDLVVVEVLDPRELELPAVGLLRLVDPESGRQLEVDTGNRAVRQRYAAAATARRQANAAAVRRAGGTHVVVRTDRDWLPDLARGLAARRRLRAAGRPAGRVR